MKKLLAGLFAILMISPTFSQQIYRSDSSGSGNGGNSIALVFSIYAQMGMSNLLKKNLISETVFNQFLKEKQEIELIITHTNLFLDKEKKNNVLMINYPTRKEIHINIKFKNLSHLRKSQMATHEYLSMMGLEKNNYHLSEKILGIPETLPKFFPSRDIRKIDLIGQKNQIHPLYYYESSRSDITCSDRGLHGLSPDNEFENFWALLVKKRLCSLYSIQQVNLAKPFKYSGDEISFSSERYKKVLIAKNKSTDKYFLFATKTKDRKLIFKGKESKLGLENLFDIYFYEKLKVSAISSYLEKVEINNKYFRGTFLKVNNDYSTARNLYLYPNGKIEAVSDVNTRESNDKVISEYAVIGQKEFRNFSEMFSVIRFHENGRPKLIAPLELSSFNFKTIKGNVYSLSNNPKFRSSNYDRYSAFAGFDENGFLERGMVNQTQKFTYKPKFTKPIELSYNYMTSSDEFSYINGKVFEEENYVPLENRELNGVLVILGVTKEPRIRDHYFQDINDHQSRFLRGYPHLGHASSLCKRYMPKNLKPPFSLSLNQGIGGRVLTIYTQVGEFSGETKVIDLRKGGDLSIKTLSSLQLKDYKFLNFIKAESLLCSLKITL